MAHQRPGKDFLTDVVKRTIDGEMSQEELTAHASTLVYVLSNYSLILIALEVASLLSRRLMSLTLTDLMVA